MINKKPPVVIRNRMLKIPSTKGNGFDYIIYACIWDGYSDGTIAFVDDILHRKIGLDIDATGTRTDDTALEGEYAWLLDLAREHGLMFPGDES